MGCRVDELFRRCNPHSQWQSEIPTLRVLPASCRQTNQTNRRKALPTRRRQHLVGATLLPRLQETEVLLRDEIIGVEPESGFKISLRFRESTLFETDQTQ